MNAETERNSAPRASGGVAQPNALLWSAGKLLVLTLAAGCGANGPDGAAPSTSAPSTSALTSGTPTASAPPAASTSAPDVTGPAPENPAPENPAPENPPTTPLGPRRGAFSAHFAAQSTCALAGQWIDLPKMEGGHPVSAAGHTALLDGSATTTVVSCQVIESPKLRVLVTLGEFGDHDSMVTFTPAVSLSEENLHALRLDVDEDTARTATDSSCSYRALEIAAAHSAFLGTFTCPHLVNDALEGSCQIDEGFFYVENCKPYEE